MSIRVAVLGAGSWGTTVASLTAANTPTTLWGRDPAVAGEVDRDHRNSRYLAGFDLHPTLRASADLAEVVAFADVVVMAVPSQSFRDILALAVPHLRPWVPVVSLTKGLERGTRLRMTQIVNELAPGHPAGVLTGPNLAKEILAGHAAAAVIAMADAHVAMELQRIFATDAFRVYTNPDVVGCEVAGALKNVIALAAGMADGLGTGDNTRATVITRGLAELTRLGVALGGRPETFAGLAGMGDLLATCISPQSRNRSVGEQLGRGRTLAAIEADMQQVAEGVKTVEVVVALAGELGVEMPIAAEVHRVIHEGAPAAEAYRGLVTRRPRAEVRHGTSPA
jgi:glycerol-3-phosphate dehydrogenase (NAD(P)+)